ncbi:MAG: hypothetical protein Q8O40_14560 [Chloroflexota bacterium]|nr:hypothetical protein [Chloroflexota bacterium]
MRWLLVTVLIVIALAVAACAAPSPTATPAPVLLIVTSPGGSTPVALIGASSDADTLRKLALAYWEAFNAYDVERVLSYLAATYRAEREGQIRTDIGRIKTFGVKLGVSEVSPPQANGDGQWEMFLNMKEPLGTRRIRMAFRQAEGDWKITYSQEVN